MPGPMPRFRIYTTPSSYGRVFRDAVLLQSRRGDALERFRVAFAGFVGVPNALPLPRARSGIYLAVRALIEPGQKVVLSPYTIHEVVNMVICAGGVPVFADIERDTCNMNPRAARDLIDDETGAVLATHLHGLAMEVEELARHCRERGVAFIEDAAQSLGTRLRGRSVGSFGDAGVFSFGMYKNLTTFLGGMLVTPIGELHESLAAELSRQPPQALGEILAEVAKAFTTDVATWPPLFGSIVYRLFRFGFLNDVELLNKRVRVEDDAQLRDAVPASYLTQMRPLQARIALAHWGRVERDIESRVRHARIYAEGLGDIEELILPPFREDGSHTYSYYPIQYRDRDALLRHLTLEGCDLAAQHLKNCADLPCFGAFARDCPNARATAAATILLPTYPRYSFRDVLRNIHGIRSFFGRDPRGFSGHPTRNFSGHATRSFSGHTTESGPE